jgi:anti-sigma B factor antagonist
MAGGAMLDDRSADGTLPPDLDSSFSPSAADGPAAKMLSVEVQRCDEAVTVVVCGEVDALTADRLNAILTAELSAGPAILLVDLAGVHFLGSTGLTVLVLTQRAARERGVDLRVVANSRATLRPLQITGMMESLAIYAGQTEALAGCSSGNTAAGPPPRSG